MYGHTNTWHEIAYKRKNGTQLILTPTRLLTSPANSSLSYRLIIGYVQTTINVPVHCESRIIITFQHYFEPWILSRGFQRSKEKKCDSLYVISFLFTGIEKVSWQECRAARWRRGGEGRGAEGEGRAVGEGREGGGRSQRGLVIDRYTEWTRN